MGMTDRQFDAYQENLLRRLEDALEKAEQSGSLDGIKKIIKDLENQLKRP